MCSMTRLLFIISVAVLAYWFFEYRGDRPIVYPPGVLVNEQPLQQEVSPSQFMLDEYQVTRRARFEIRARVLSKEPYYLRQGVRPVTTWTWRWAGALMSDQAVLDQDRHQHRAAAGISRRYEYPAPLAGCSRSSAHSSNMHMIPARKSVERRLKDLRPGDIVEAGRSTWWMWTTLRAGAGGPPCHAPTPATAPVRSFTWNH